MKTILITGASDGIGFELAKSLAADGHRLLLHGRNKAKLDECIQQIIGAHPAAQLSAHIADFAKLDEVASMAASIKAQHEQIDVLINNAGIFKTPNPIAASGHDIRFVVNTFAPIVLTRALLPLLGECARVLNLSSAAQSSINPRELSGQSPALREFDIYGQSKLALTMWTRVKARDYPSGPNFFAINPGSMLASKMVKEGFGVAGNDIAIGVNILREGALSPSFDGRSGAYYDNDRGGWGPPHPDALNDATCEAVMAAIEGELKRLGAA